MVSKRRRNTGRYQGAPTREGRIIVFFFGLPFILGGILMLGGALFGNEPEWLALLLGGIAFLIIGLVVWRPAFPNVVNRFRNSQHPVIEWCADKAGRIGFSLFILIMFGTPMLMAVGIIPTEKTDWPVPRWVGIVAAGLFLVVALYILLQQRNQRLKPELRKQIMGLFPLLIVTGMAVIADWVAFGPGERAFSMGASDGIFGIRIGGDELIGRALFGASGIFLSVISLIGWWKYLRRDW